MEASKILEYCLNKKGAYEDFPFGEIPICVKINNKIFAQIYPNSHDYKITLKCNPDSANFYRQIYPEIVTRGYHCPPVQQPFWNTIDLNHIPEEELLNMIDHAYEQVFLSFSKKIQKELNEEN